MSINTEERNTSLGHMPSTDRWIFDQSVVNVFEDMLQRSIPQYEVMRKAVYDMGVGLVQPNTYIVDLGCSKGDALAPFVDKFGIDNNYLGIDVSQPMLEEARARFQKQINEKTVEIENLDLSNDYPTVKTSLTLSILTLQFTPLAIRRNIIRNVFQNTLPGGGLILVEKIRGSTQFLDQMLIDNYHKLKRDNGYSVEEIERKRSALEGVLIPCTSKWNEETLADVGFDNVDCFWRWMNFAGYVAIKR